MDSPLGGGGKASRTPLIADAPMPVDNAFEDDLDIHNFVEDDYDNANPFDFSNSPNMLQSLETIGSNGQKAFISPQELSKAESYTESPNDSANDSFQDSSSESSSKRAASSASSPPKGQSNHEDVTMDDSNAVWDDQEMDNLMFHSPAQGTNPDSMFEFGEMDPSFVESTFNFESPASIPEQPPSASSQGPPSASTAKTTPSPNPAAKTKIPRAKKAKQTAHQKRNSRSSTNGGVSKIPKSVSREVSPLSSVQPPRQNASATNVNGASITSQPAFQAPNGAFIWPNQAAFAAAQGPNALAAQAQLAAAMAPPMALQQMCLPGPSTQYNFPGQYQLKILPTPVKSRVETQVPIKIQLSPLPPGITKLHLPTHTISKPKLQARPNRSPEMLELYVSLYCTSAVAQPHLKMRALKRAASHPHEFLVDLDDEENAPQNGGEVRICKGCITRERKRTARKKNWKPEDERIWQQHEEHRVIVFNTSEIKEWQTMPEDSDRPDRPPAFLVEAPMRIACYCRHHSEKMGFNVVFTIKDYQDRIIAQAMSNPIMITDDHKTHPIAQLPTSGPAVSDTVTSSTIPALIGAPSPEDIAAMAQSGMPQPGMPIPADVLAMQIQNAQGQLGQAMSTVSSMPPSRSQSRQASPNQDGPTAKKRKASSSRVPEGLAMTRLDTSPAPRQGSTNSLPANTPPFPPNQAGPPMEQMLGQQTFGNGPPTPNGTEQPLFFGNHQPSSIDNRFDNFAAHLYSAPTSTHPSRAPSPNSLRSGVGAPPSQASHAIMGNIYGNQSVRQQLPTPVIHKIIPNEGPTNGGIEVTILGAAFFQGLEVWFGDCKATTTTFWGESSLVCLLPPSPVEGAVPVTMKQPSAGPSQSFPVGQPPVFRYIDDSEPKLIRLALSVLGHKMSGQMMDVNELARRILNDGNHSAWSGGSSSMGGSAPGGGPNFNSASREHLESQLLKCLDLIDLDDSEFSTQLDLTVSEDQHTMLHLACSLGYHRFVAALLARGANPNAQDLGGFTPLHMAAIHHQPEIVRRLMLARADPMVRSISGLYPADVAQSRHVVRVIRQSESHVRARSGGSLHSRSNSATSLRSLWEPMSKVRTSDGLVSTDSGTESPEYSSGDFEDDVSEDDDFLDMRRPSQYQEDQDRLRMLRRASSKASSDMASTEPARGMPIRDQFQQQFQTFQQSVGQHLPGLPQLPNMPQLPHIPHMPTFNSLGFIPDYQTYFQEHPFMQRVQQFMPTISGTRPGSADGEQSKIDHRWWDLMSYMNTSGTPPPAYEEIYPQQDADRKQASAVQAAADAEADLKCSQLYDQSAEASTSVPTTDQTEAEVEQDVDTKSQTPSVLTIGRKHAITKEQQEQFLRVHEQNFKTFSNDRNLFFIWIPLLILMIGAATYHFFPAMLPLAIQTIRHLIEVARSTTTRVLSEAPETLRSLT